MRVLVLVVSSLAILLLARVAEASFDDHTVHVVFEKDVTEDLVSDLQHAEMRCLEAQFSALVPTGGIAGPAVIATACEMLGHTQEELQKKASELDGKIVFLASAHCSIMTSRLIGAFSNSSIRALVVDNFLDFANENRLPTWARGFTGISVPVCSISRVDMDPLSSYAKAHPWEDFAHVRLNHRQREELFVVCDQCTVQGLFVDAIALAISDGAETVGVPVSEFYQSVAVKLRAHSPSARFMLGLSDGFSTGAGDWRCTKPNAFPKADENDVAAWVDADLAPAGNRDPDSSSADLKNAFVRPKVFKGRDIKPVLQTEALYVWLPEAEATASGDVVTCFASRHSAAVTKYGFRYEYVPVPETFAEAGRRCKTERNGTLVSIHSWPEDRLVGSLMPMQDGGGAWIGLERIDKRDGPHYRWQNGAPSDYSNLAYEPGFQRGDAFCVSEVKTRGLLGWRCEACAEKKPYVCKSVAPSIHDDRTDESEERCFAYYMSYNSAAAMVPPQRLIGLRSGMCSYGSEYSCCSANMIDKYIAPLHEKLKASLQSPACARALEDVACSMCLPAAHRFISWDRSRMVLRWCRDTCVFIHESCKDETFLEGSADKEEFKSEPCRYLATKIAEAGGAMMGLELETVDGHSRQCLRIDSLPPKLLRVEMREIPNQDYFLVRLVFNEEIEFRESAVMVMQRADDMSGMSQTLYGSELGTTHMVNDTIVLKFVYGTLDKGVYTVELPNFAIFDMAGNMFAGTHAAPHPFLLTVRMTEMPDWPPPRESGEYISEGGDSIMPFISWITIAGILGSAIIHEVRRRRRRLEAREARRERETGTVLDSMRDQLSGLSARLTGGRSPAAFFAPLGDRAPEDSAREDAPRGDGLETELVAYRPPDVTA